ncbi:hypothetical protein BD779DRAFT_1519607 [Infundibulicybe gibba]|nr:hypothetical protein BD779DRAFT_1519607 [Infundibulicybe gibba]
MLPIPLSFDRVMDGQPITSSLLIFRLPIELISHVTPYFSPTDLASLALVDRDCRQLARSIQFSNVRVDRGNDGFLEFLDLLEAESRDRKNAITPPAFTIGTCVQRVYTFHGSVKYLDKVCVVIRDALPNLRRLDWETMAVMSGEMIRCFISTPVKHLALRSVRVDDTFEVQRMGSTHPWALESLVLDVAWPTFDRVLSNEDTAQFIMSLLYPAAPTLSDFVWAGRVGQSYAHSLPESPPLFPNLRNLTLDTLRIDKVMLSALLGPQSGVTSLTTDVFYQETDSFLKSRGCLPSLTHINWATESPSDHSSMISFIGNNTQLQSLTTTCELPSSTLDGCVMPLLSRFRELTTLQLTWAGDHICSESLRLIGSIVTLKHLWLSAGPQPGWQINHTDFAEAFSSLTSLKILCLFRDTYATDVHAMPSAGHRTYYINRTLPQAVDVMQYLGAEDRALLDGARNSSDEELSRRGQILRRAWERWHRECMTAFSAQYAKRLPQMRWCYLGQIPFECYGDGKVAPAMTDRDETSYYLMELWPRVTGLSVYRSRGQARF